MSSPRYIAFAFTAVLLALGTTAQSWYASGFYFLVVSELLLCHFTLSSNSSSSDRDALTMSVQVWQKLHGN